MKDTQNTDKLIKTAKKAAIAAADIIMEAFWSRSFTNKSSDEIVTETDPKAQAAIVDILLGEFPDSGILAEEGLNGEKLYKKPPAEPNGVWWVIDPIDGTTSFAHSLPSFSVCIGAFADGVPMAGVVYNPNTQTFYAGTKGTGAWANEHRITVSDEPINPFAGIALDIDRKKAELEQFWDMVDSIKLRNYGSTALHISYVANGSLIAAASNRIKFWDIAAAGAVHVFAGGTLTDWHNRDIFPFDIQAYQAQKVQFIASNKSVHTDMLALLKEE
ncbi:inositol monophosphatase family protein [Limihaloglobus sulfuriphilus]|nr:inositol monophosphatase [Limihaloglobus sulfuriphilus]